MTASITAPATAPAADVRPVRLFVGLKIGDQAAQELVRIAQVLRGPAVRAIAADDIHLTLVPPWQESSPATAIEKLRPVAARSGAFALIVEHVGYGPDPRRPRYLWADCVAAEELTALRAALLTAYGAADDDRPFRPHLTLARLRNNGRAIARKHPIDRPIALRQQIESVELFQSPAAGGRGYRVLASIPLGGGLPRVQG
jgi:2'-5' RNA ligase